MNLLPLELFELILDDHRIKIFDIQLVSKYFLFVIRNILVINIQICLDSNTVCHHVINNFKFRNLSIGWACDVNSFIDELKNCHTLYLYGTRVTNKCVNELKKNGCKVFSDCKKTNI